MSKKGVYIRDRDSAVSFEEYDERCLLRLAIRTHFSGVQDGVVYLDEAQVAALREFLNEEGDDGKQ